MALPGLVAAQNLADVADRERAWDNLGLNISETFQSWSPAQITTALWLDAADASTVTTVSSAVSQWNDKSGNARHVTQAIEASRPTFTANAINGRSALDFDGSNDTLINTSAALQRNVGGTSLFAVTKLDVNTAGEKLILQTLTGLSGSRSVLRYAAANTGFNAGGRRLQADSFQSQGASSYSSNVTINCAIFNYSSATLSLIENGAVTVNAATFQTAGNTENNAGGLHIGASAVGATLWDGYFAEIIIVESAVPLSTRQRIEGYLAHKWGLTANLPSDHPYRIIPPAP